MTGKLSPPVSRQGQNHRSQPFWIRLRLAYTKFTFVTVNPGNLKVCTFGLINVSYGK